MARSGAWTLQQLSHRSGYRDRASFSCGLPQIRQREERREALTGRAFLEDRPEVPMDSEELRARVEQLERELILLKHVVRFILAAHRCNPPSFSGQRVDPATVRQVRQEIQAAWNEEYQQWITPDPRSL